MLDLENRESVQEVLEQFETEMQHREDWFSYIESQDISARDQLVDDDIVRKF